MSITQEEKELLINLSGKNKIRLKKGWKNFSENLNAPEVLVMDIEDIESLSNLVAKIDEINQTKAPAQRIILRTAAGGRETEYSQSFSFTPGAEADVIIRLVGNEFRSIQKTSQQNVVCVGGSVQIGELDTELFEKHNLSLSTSSLIPYVTVAGLAANAGHGTGKDQPGFCGLIKAMTLCLPNGKIVRIDHTHPDFEAIRASNFGLFGIVINMELECIEAKNMICVMDVSNIPDLIKKIKDGLFFKYPYVSVMYMPTYQPDEMTSERYNNVIIYNWMPADKNMPIQNSHPTLAHFTQELEIKSENVLRITDLYRDKPQLIPYFMRYLVTKAGIGSKDAISVGPWPTVHYQTAFPHDIDDADYLFEVGKGCDEILQALETIVTSLTKQAAKGEYPITDAMYFRFISGSEEDELKPGNVGLSTSAHKKGKYVCGLDMVSSNGIPGYSEFKEEMKAYFLNSELHAKPHWGKYVPLDVDYRKVYGEEIFDHFVDVLENWYKTHNIKISNSMLLNSFFCQVLQLPYQPELGLDQFHAFNRETMRTNSKWLASKIAKNLDGDIAEAKELKKRLKGIDNGKVANNKSTVFQQPTAAKKQDEVVRRENKSCCVLF